MIHLTDDVHIWTDTVNTTVDEGSVILTADEAEHLAGHVIPAYISAMQDNAKQLRDNAAVLRTLPPKEPKEGTIDITPHPAGLDRMAAAFDSYAENAYKLIADLRGPQQ